MTILNPKGFKLPRVEREKFITLINLGLDYNRERGIFSIKDCNNIEKLIDTLGAILDTEVVFLQSCTRCGKEFPALTASTSTYAPPKTFLSAASARNASETEDNLKDTLKNSDILVSSFDILPGVMKKKVVVLAS